ncbi:MAG: hypothetical protein ACOY4I_04750 [Bacillota bacterium]
MPDTLKRIYTGTLGAVSADLYTVPVSTKTIITEVVLANKTAGAVAATVMIGTENIVPGKNVPANDALVVKLHTVMEAGEIIKGLAGSGSAIDCRISGVEVV